MSSEKILVLVDGYSSGSLLPAVLRERGWSCVHVASMPDPPPYFLTAYRPEDYVAHFSYHGDLEDLVSRLKRFKPRAVLPGTESGVVAADLIAAGLGLPGNDPATSMARRDKYEMHNRLKQAGLRSLDHFLATELDQLVEWAERGPWPVVVKPPASAGTDSVTFCDNADELRRIFERLHGATNQLGLRNDAVLAQRFVSGQEYFINGISGNGRHVITEIWRTEKLRVPGAGYIYDRSVLFDPTDPRMATIVDYVQRVLPALGVRYGAHHTELMVDDDGPVLIECASRLSGGLNRPAANHGVGISMLDLVANLVDQGESYVEQLWHDPPRHRAPLWQVQFISDQEGVVAESRYEELIPTLRSTTWLQRAPKPGDRVTRTTDLYSSPGIVFMSHPDAAVMQADYETVRTWEREHRLFTVS